MPTDVYWERRWEMYCVKIEHSFDAAHFLKDYNGKCKNIHGHHWRVVVEVQNEILKDDLQSRGMVVDFSVLKDELKAVCDCFDHMFIYETGSLKEATIRALKDEAFSMLEVGFRPTAENFARHFYGLLEEKGFDVHRVEVYETPSNCAAYEE